jgi:hypothetical protein
VDVPASVRFAAAARAISGAARERGLIVPAFRTPPRLRGADRTLRRSGAAPVVAVRLRGRSFADVVADMIDGVLAANGLAGGDAAAVRARLDAAATEAHAEAA